MKQILYIISFLVLVGCSDDPTVDCDGFAGEPSLEFKSSNSDTLAIFFLNAEGNGDTIYGYNGDVFSVPVDMSSDTMFLELIGDSSLGKLVFSYALEQKLCPTSDELKQHFRVAKFTSSSTFLNIATVIDGGTTDLDTAAGYASFINQTRTTRYFEVNL